MLLLACAPPLTDAWTPTREACHLSATDAVPLRAAWPDAERRHHFEIDEPCARALLADVHADPEALLVAIGADGDLAAHLARGADPEAPLDALHGLVQGLYWLLASEVPPPEVDPWVARSLRDVIRNSGLPGGLPGQVRYDLVVSRVARVAVDREGYTAMASDGTLWIADHLARGAPPVAAAMLVHEARHRDGLLQNHVPCEDETGDPPACDDDGEGAVGWGLTSLTLDLHADPAFDNACGDTEAPTEHVRDHLLTWRRLWADELLLSEAPEDERDRCP